MDRKRHIKLFKNYFKKFYVSQPQVVRNKINYVLRIIETQQTIPRKFFRSLEDTDGIYEIRVEIESNIYRIFCCQDKGAIIVLFHGIQKKTQKTPKKEIKKAEAIRKEYLTEKETNKNG